MWSDPHCQRHVVLPISYGRCLGRSSSFRNLSANGSRGRWRSGASAARTSCLAQGPPARALTTLLAACAGQLVRRAWPGEPSRSLHCVWHAPGGGTWRVLHAYVPPGAGQHAGYEEARSCLVEAMRTADVPTIVAGDFNCELDDHPLEVALAIHGWADPLAHQPTSSAALRLKRIDWTVLNRAARARLRGAGVDWGLGLWVHAGHLLGLHLRGQGTVPVWRPVAQAPTSVAAGSEAEVAAALRGARVAIAARDLDTAWAALDAAARAHHGATGLAARPGATAGGAAEWVAPPARARAQVREEPQELRRARRHAGLLRATMREAVQSGRGAVAASVARFLAIALHAEAAGSEWSPHLVARPCIAELMGLVAEVDGVVARLDATNGTRRRESWHQWCGDQWATGGRRLHAWLRSPPQVTPPPRPNGRVRLRRGRRRFFVYRSRHGTQSGRG